jgi:hypothetical protein
MQHWDLFRVVRLGLGLLIIVQAIITKDITSGLIGVLFTAMPLFNIGCCSTMGCAPSRTSHKVETDEISFEEIK